MTAKVFRLKRQGLTSCKMTLTQNAPGDIWTKFEEHDITLKIWIKSTGQKLLNVCDYIYYVWLLRVYLNSNCQLTNALHRSVMSTSVLGGVFGLCHCLQTAINITQLSPHSIFTCRLHLRNCLFSHDLTDGGKNPRLCYASNWIISITDNSQNKLQPNL